MNIEKSNISNLIKTEVSFKKKFKHYIYKSNRYILFIDDFNPRYEAELCLLINQFLHRNKIIKVAICIKSNTTFTFCCDDIEIKLFFLQEDYFNKIKTLYVLYPICDNFKFLTMDLSGRFIPEDMSFLDLAKLELK